MNEASLDIESYEEQIATALELLYLANLLTPDNRTIIQSHPELNDLIKALRTLQDEGILTQESFDEIQSHQIPHIAAEVLKLLHKVGILTAENRAIIQLDLATIRNAALAEEENQETAHLRYGFFDNIFGALACLKLSAIATSLELFYTVEILTQENFDCLRLNSEPERIVSLLVCLYYSKILTQENFDCLRLHPDPERMGSLLTFLHFSKILTQENFDAIRIRSDFDQMNDVFELFNKNGILTQENFEGVLSHTHLGLVSGICKILHVTGILTQANLEMIFFDAGLLSTSSATVLCVLYKAQIFNQKNLDAIREYTKKALLPFIALLLHSTDEAKILTQENFERILAHPEPVALFTTLQSLEAAGILTQENFAVLRLKCFDKPSVVAGAFSSLQAAGILTQESIEGIQYHVAPLKFMELFEPLHNSNMLTQENFEVIRRHPCPIEFILVLRILSRVDILNQANLKRLHSLSVSALQVLADAILKLYISDILTQENFMAVFNHKVLLMPGIWNRIPEQAITLEIFNELIRKADQANPEEQISAYIDSLVPIINDIQSTHTASVHASVSESATRLANRYENFTSDSLNELMTLTRHFLANLLSDDSFVTNAAKRCMVRIIESDHIFLDSVSGVTLKQLYYLIMLAAVDKNNQYGNGQDAINQLIEGLYEIQRGYNLSEEGKDDGEEDKPICDAGAFNKLIEKLQGIHSDCEINFVTSKTASLKLPIIVRETALQYLSQLANPANAEDFLAFTYLVQQIKVQGIEIIWDKIKEYVLDKMFNDFSILYKYRENKALIDLVEAGLHTTLADKALNSFQEKIQNSNGYHQYCSQMLRQSRLFSSAVANEDTLQEAYQCYRITP